MTEAAGVLPEISQAIVRAEIATLRRSGSPRRVIALRGRPRWTGPADLEVEGDRVRVVPCVSPLAIREALLTANERWLVIITDRDDADIGPSLCARFVKGRVRLPNLWETVGWRFQAPHLDATLRAEGKELAEALLAEAPVDGWPPARGGVLSRDVAFEALCGQVLGLPADRIDAIGLLEWTLDPLGVGGLTRLSSRVRERMLVWLGDRTGSVGSLTLDVVRAGQTADAVPLALIAGLLAEPGADAVRAAEARGILAHRYGGQTPVGPAAIAWAESARGLVERRLSDPRVPLLLSRADAILASAHATAAAASSAVLRPGFEARAHQFARFVSESVCAPGDPRPLAGVEAAFRALTDHVLAGVETRRRDQAHMALRLVRWLSDGEEREPTTIGEAVVRHIHGDAWVDWARARVWVGDDDPVVAGTYRQLYAAATARRAAHDERFANLLAAHLREDAATGNMVQVEDVVRQVVLPLARERGVLLVVIDGMSAAIASELAGSLIAGGWPELLPIGSVHRRGALAALPTITEVCRTSLLAGSPMTGGQEEERAGLRRVAEEEGLFALLFHKADLERAEAGDTLPAPIRGAIEDAGVRVVAVVLNAVDDALESSDMSGIEWGVPQVKHLRALLHAARNAGRTVVLASDHGHVVERGNGELRAHKDAGSARWRAGGPDTLPPGTGEIALTGRRVRRTGGVIVPWGEALRYKPLKAGYHGGASPAEVVVPLLVFGLTVPAGWEPASPQAPPWWLGALTPAVVATPAPEPAHGPPVQISLLEIGQNLADAVIASTVYAAQRQRAQRIALDDGKVSVILRALLQSGGRLPQDAIAAAAGIPVYRLPGTMTALQRMLNVEGYEVIGYDADGVTVVLNEGLLREQFDLGR